MGSTLGGVAGRDRIGAVALGAVALGALALAVAGCYRLAEPSPRPRASRDALRACPVYALAPGAGAGGEGGADPARADSAAATPGAVVPRFDVPPTGPSG